MECCSPPLDQATKTVPTTAAPSQVAGIKFYFVQECPTCVRRLRTPFSLLGREVACQHCGTEFVSAEFVPQGRDLIRRETQRPTNLERAEALLARLA